MIGENHEPKHNPRPGVGGMTFKIHFEYQDGTADHFTVSGETVEEIAEKAAVEVAKRGGKNPWSEEI